MGCLKVAKEFGHSCTRGQDGCISAGIVPRAGGHWQADYCASRYGLPLR